MIRTIPTVNRDALEQGLRRLKLRHMREHLEDINELALQEEPSYLDFLGYLVSREVEGREQTRRAIRLKAARFPFYRTVDDFDFTVQNSVSQQTLRDLAQLEFVKVRENVVLLGPPGVGKTHLAVALGIEAVNQGYRVQFITAQELADQLYSALADGTVAQTMNKLLRNELIILDELGYVQFDTTGSDHLFQLIAQAYEHRSLIVTSNLDFQDWGRLFDQPATAAAFLDRLLHHAHVITLKGDSYRIRHRLTPPAAQLNR
ncbi:MAG: IS21-like element helper ATPase IstB [Limnochordia bacterium]